MFRESRSKSATQVSSGSPEAPQRLPRLVLAPQSPGGIFQLTLWSQLPYSIMRSCVFWSQLLYSILRSVPSIVFWDLCPQLPYSILRSVPTFYQSVWLSSIRPLESRSFILFWLQTRVFVPCRTAPKPCKGCKIQKIKSKWRGASRNSCFYFATLTVFWRVDGDMAWSLEQSRFQNVKHSSKNIYQQALRNFDIFLICSTFFHFIARARGGEFCTNFIA